MDCKWVAHGTPVLVRPDSGIVFGFCGGTHTYALKLPDRALGSPLDLSILGPDWISGRWLAQESKWCLAAYENAAPALNA